MLNRTVKHCQQLWNGFNSPSKHFHDTLAHWPDASSITSKHLGPDVHTVLQNVHQEDARSLCNVFQPLICQIRERLPINWIIDGINLYETDEHLADISIVIFIWMILFTGLVLKTIKHPLTSSLPILEVHQIFNEDHNPCLLHIKGNPTAERSLQLNIFW